VLGGSCVMPEFISGMHGLMYRGGFTPPFNSQEICSSNHNAVASNNTDYTKQVPRCISTKSIDLDHDAGAATECR
jgi:hypothetical protein